MHLVLLLAQVSHGGEGMAIVHLAVVAIVVLGVLAFVVLRGARKRSEERDGRPEL